MNIGVAELLVPNARAQDLTKMLSALVGRWQGTYMFFDEREERQKMKQDRVVVITGAAGGMGYDEFPLAQELDS